MTGDVYEVPSVGVLGDTTRAILGACADLHGRRVRLVVAGVDVDTTLAALIVHSERDRRSKGTRAGIAATGRKHGAKAKLSPSQVAELVTLWDSGQHTTAELAEMFNVRQDHDRA